MFEHTTGSRGKKADSDLVAGLLRHISIRKKNTKKETASHMLPDFRP